MKYLSRIGKLILIELMLVIVGYILLVIVYCIPVDDMKSHVKESIKIFEKEGSYPQLVIDYRDSQLDNWTDAEMLLMAIYEDAENNVFKQAATNTSVRIYQTSPVEALLNKFSGNGDQLEAFSYGRYWHGYLIFLKPLLVFLNYGEIKYLNMTFQLILILVVMYLLTTKNIAHYGMPFCFYILSLNPAAMFLSMQFSSTYALTLISVIVLLQKDTIYKQRSDLVTAHFLIIGCLTSYFDFLTYPLHTLAIPLVLWLSISNRSRYKTAIKLGISWIIGYGGMWSGKWFLGSLITGNNILKDAFENAVIRTSYNVRGSDFTYLDILQKTFSALNKPILFIAIATALLYIFICICKHNAKPDIKFAILLVGIAMMPLGWFAVMGNHSYLHYWFTFREWSICLFALQMMAVSCNKKYQHLVP